MEKMKVETGKKKVALLHDQIHEKVCEIVVKNYVITIGWPLSPHWGCISQVLAGFCVWESLV